jgi:hypothetical protein|tara:strand:+ start:549 stop:884 length:336 start_codon:yes stop_codon:yes gene_type:complete
MILEAILLINPDAKACVYGSDIETCTINWLNGTTAISKEDIKAKLEEAKFNMTLNKLRRKRNILLEDTDFYALSDVTMADDMKTYRQALRDITNGLTTVDQIKAVKFPTKP